MLGAFRIPFDALAERKYYPPSSIDPIQIQDIYCKKCGNIRSDLLKKTCDCSGTYQVLKDEAFNLIALHKERMLHSFLAIA